MANVTHIHRGTIIAHHHVLTGYGNWLPNDLRGSGSMEIRKADLRDLAEIHFGRRKVQPSKQELREFFETAEPLLDFEPARFEEEARIAIAEAIQRVIKREGYTCWAFASLWNHTHAMTRVHRAPGHVIWEKFAAESRNALRELGLFPKDHPIWSSRPYVVFKTTVRAVRVGVDYINQNPEKEGLHPQNHSFVIPYDGWPLNRRKR
jgi:hypothetical protein